MNNYLDIKFILNILPQICPLGAIYQPNKIQNKETHKTLTWIPAPWYEPCYRAVQSQVYLL